VLTVTDQIHTARISLNGDYLNATFTATSDNHGGTDVVAQATMFPVVHAFVGAMAGFGASAGHGVHTGEAWSRRGPMLTLPRVAIA
jgi:hypothetical protein